MTHLGILCPGAIGHLNPMCTIARELLSRGHRVTLFGVPDIQARVANVAGLEFAQLGAAEFPLGAIDRMYKELGQKSNLDGLKYTLTWMGRENQMLFAEAPAAIEARGIDLLLIDQVTGAGTTIAEFLQIPFVTICNALPINREPSVPPFFTTWTYQDTWWAKARNQLGNSLLDYLTETVWQQILTQRRSWKLPPLADREAGFSQLLQISQLPPEFDFPRQGAAQMHYVGPFLAPATAEPISFAGLDFPFDRLTAKPLIYASLGTLQNQQLDIFKTIASACVDLDAQLVISLGIPIAIRPRSNLMANRLWWLMPPMPPSSLDRVWSSLTLASIPPSAASARACPSSPSQLPTSNQGLPPASSALAQGNWYRSSN